MKPNGGNGKSADIDGQSDSPIADEDHKSETDVGCAY